MNAALDALQARLAAWRTERVGDALLVRGDCRRVAEAERQGDLLRPRPTQLGLIR